MPVWKSHFSFLFSNRSNASDFQVAVGRVTISGVSNPRDVIGVRRVIQHSEFDLEHTENDIAILELGKRIPRGNSLARPILLPPSIRSNPEPNTNLITASWGRVHGRRFSLLKATSKVMGEAECAESLTNAGIYKASIPFTQICTENSRQGTCKVLYCIPFLILRVPKSRSKYRTNFRVTAEDRW